MVQDGNLVLLDLSNLLLRQAKGRSENVTLDRGICRNSASCVEDKRRHGELRSLPPEAGGDVADRFCNVSAAGGHSDHDHIRGPGFGDSPALGKTASFSHPHALAAVDNLSYSSDRHLTWFLE